MAKLTNEDKLNFYMERQRKGDVERLAESTGFTTRFIYYVRAGQRRANDVLANAMYNISRRRVKTV
jgi:hypothetical protein